MSRIVVTYVDKCSECPWLDNLDGFCGMSMDYVPPDPDGQFTIIPDWCKLDVIDDGEDNDD